MIVFAIFESALPLDKVAASFGGSPSMPCGFSGDRNLCGIFDHKGARRAFDILLQGVAEKMAEMTPELSHPHIVSKTSFFSEVVVFPIDDVE